MHSSSATQRQGYSWPLPGPVVLTSPERKLVSGGGSNVQHGNPGGDTRTNAANGPPGGDGGASHSGFTAADK
jgi:hypothetical protein